MLEIRNLHAAIDGNEILKGINLTFASVDLPEPLGPIIACISPFLIVRLIPFRISLPSMAACRFRISNMKMIAPYILMVTGIGCQAPSNSDAYQHPTPDTLTLSQ